MPAKGKFDPTSLASRVREWFTANPGEHRPRDVAAGLGIPEEQGRSKWTMRVGTELSRMALAGDLVRRRQAVPSEKPGDKKRPITYYALADPGTED